ncbi:MAG: protein kinase [Sphingobacteriales bacterium]|nr:MAG: protein kinase [Sphingobacteriales bacterium]
MLLQNRYEYNPLTDALADGSAAKVYVAYDNVAETPVIIKFYHAVSVEHHTFQNNMERIKQLNHPNLVQLFDYFVLETINHLGQSTQVKVGVWEYVPGNTVELPLSNEQTESTLRSTIKGLEYLYQNGCAHLDLESDNILITSDGQVKLNNYEITNTDPENEPNIKKDLKGIGEVLHLYCTGKPPKNNFPKSIETGIREVYAVIIRKCLKNEANSVSEILDSLDNYERNKRFEEVLPLQTKQAQSRYTFEMTEDILQDTNHSYLISAYDNLLDKPVTLEIFKEDPNRTLLQQINQSQYSYLFKIELPDEAEGSKTALAGIVSKSSAESDDNHLIALLSQEEPVSNVSGDTATLEANSAHETEDKHQATENLDDNLTDVEADSQLSDNKTTDSNKENNSIFVIEVKDYIQAPHASNNETEELEQNEISIILPPDDVNELSEVAISNDENAIQNAIHVEIGQHELMPDGELDESHFNTEVIVKKAIEQVNADLGKEIHEIQEWQKMIDEKTGENTNNSNEQTEITGNFAPTGLIKIEALSQLREDLDNANENEDSVEKDRYIDIAINTLKNNKETEETDTTDTQHFENEAMEQVRKDLEKLLSENDKDETNKEV